MARLLDKINRLPPFVCRLMARKQDGWKPLTIDDIAKASGIPRSTVHELSSRNSWNGVAVDIADRFAAACGVDLLTPGEYIFWLRTHGMVHIKKCSPIQRKCFAKLLETKPPA